MSTDPGTFDPFVVLGGKLALLFLLLPVAKLGARAVLGTNRDDALTSTHPGTKALALGLGVAAAGLAIGADLLDPRLLGPTIAAHPATRTLAAIAASLVAALPAVWEVRANRPFPTLDSPARGATVVVAVVACLPLVGLLGLRARTALGDDPIGREVVGGSGLRSIVVPSDPGAHLGVALLAAGRDDLDRARNELALARALGVEPAYGLEVESELAARIGDCRSAVALFRRALEARVPRDPEELLRHRLDLGGFHLPPSLVTRCDYASGTAR